MRLNSILIITFIVNIIMNAFGYIIDSDYLSKSTIFWSLLVLVISTVASILLSNLIKIQDERDELNDRLSKLLIRKENSSQFLDVTIHPKIINDTLTVNRRTMITLTINAIYDLQDKPSFTLESNYELRFEMPDLKITPVQHLNKFVYYFKELKVRNGYLSKRFFTYEVILIPLIKGQYDLKFIVESGDNRNESSFSIFCE